LEDEWIRRADPFSILRADMFEHLSHHVRGYHTQAQRSEASGAVGYAKGLVLIFMGGDFSGLDTHTFECHAHCQSCWIYTR
jgi:hypothetical protein